MQIKVKKSFLDIMKVGVGGLINSTTIAGTVAVVTATISYYGVDALAGYGLGSRLEIIITPLVFRTATSFWCYPGNIL